MNTCTRYTLITLGIYIFIAFGVYFVLCVIRNSEWDEVDNFGFAMTWPIVVIAGALWLPFWILKKAADRVHDYIRGQTDETDE